MNSLGLVIGCNNNISDPVELSLPQVCDSPESKDSTIAVQFPSMDRRKPLEKDAKDLMADSDSDQQQQTSLSSTSSSSRSLDHTPTEVNLPPSQQLRNVKKSVKASSSRSLRGRRCNQSIKAAKHRFLLEKSAKQQETKAVSEVVKAENQTNEMSFKSSAPLLNPSDASNSSSSLSSTSQSSAPQKAAPQPLVLLPSQSSYPQNPTPFSAIANGFYNQSGSHSRPNSAFQHPLPQLPSSSSYSSSAMMTRNHRFQKDWATREYLFIKVCGLPDITTTRDLWAAFEREGHIAHIRLYENAKGYRDGGASIKFRYASKFGPWSSHRNN